MPATLSRLSIFFINYILRELDNKKILLYKLSVRHLVIKPTCVNVVLVGKSETDLYYKVFNFILLMKDVATRRLAKKLLLVYGWF